MYRLGRAKKICEQKIKVALPVDPIKKIKVCSGHLSQVSDCNQLYGPIFFLDLVI